VVTALLKLCRSDVMVKVTSGFRFFEMDVSEGLNPI
jgi:hypothetical protein